MLTSWTFNTICITKVCRVSLCEDSRSISAERKYLDMQMDGGKKKRVSDYARDAKASIFSGQKTINLSRHGRLINHLPLMKAPCLPENHSVLPVIFIVYELYNFWTVHS